MKRHVYTRGFRVALAFLVGLTVLTTTATRSDAHPVGREWADVLGQGGDGVYAEDGAKLVRRHHSVKVRWRIPTLVPGSYAYPTPDMIPPGAPPHPPIEPGRPEVFTLWAFVFNNPDLCTDPCDFDDIGDTPAEGGIFQLDATIAKHRRTRMGGRIRIGDEAVVGSAFVNPAGAEIHVAMAPHGRARSGDELKRQMSGSVGNPGFWWVAVFN